MSNNNTLLEVENLKLHFPIEEGIFFRKKIGAVRAVDGVSFSIREGETLGLVGESGCGKSTTIRAINQLYKPTGGKIRFLGKDLSSATKKEMLCARMDMQMIFQDPFASLNPRMTIGDIIAEPLVIYKNRRMLDISAKEIKMRVEELLEKVGLYTHFINRYPHEFSGGQRQRVGIARTLALKPKLILADEPVSALDVSIQSQIINLLMDLQDEFKLTYLIIAHDLSVIEHISDRVAVMYLGKIMEIADSKMLYDNPSHPYTQALLSAVPIPDPEVEKKRQRIILEGDVPSPDQERKGCYFCDRCSKVMEKCRTNVPPFYKLNEEHQVACFLYE